VRWPWGASVEARLEVGQDAGCASIVGIDPTILSGGKDGHFGFRGMRERAARIGAKLTIMSAIGTGTDVTLVVPRSVAFKNGFPVRRRFKRAFERPPHPSRPKE
jgi:hypothetical protein